MFQSSPAALPLTRKVLRVLIALNLVWGFLILALLVASLVAPATVLAGLGVPPAAGNAARVLGMRLIMVLGIAAVPLVHAALRRLTEIVETVRRGDPFVRENAGRLARIAWVVLGLEVLHLGVGGVIAAASSRGKPLGIGWSFSPVPWLAVLLLFVLARVFERGAAMREDLEGTV